MKAFSPAASFTRPADTTAYASGDLIANSTTAGSVTPLSWPLPHPGAAVQIKRARIRKTTTTVTNFKAYLHLYSAAPAVANGDNGAYSSTKAANYIGSILIDGTTTPGAKFSDGAAAFGAAAAGSEFNVQPGSTIYGLLEAQAAYAPGNAEVFTVTLDLLEFVGE
jgi:hypothetical protein